MVSRAFFLALLFHAVSFAQSPASRQWRVVEELRIGEVEGGSEEVFADVSALAVDKMGRIYVGDRQDKTIKVFDARGRFVRRIGRAGGGPGEFRSLEGLVWLAPDKLLAVDEQGHHYTVFDTTGAFIKSYTRASNTFHSSWPGGVDIEHHLYDATSRGFGARNETVLLRLDHDFKVSDTIALSAFAPKMWEVTLPGSGGRATTATVIPLAPWQLWALSLRGTLFVGVNDRYHIEQRTLDGKVLSVIDRPFKPVPVTNEDRAAITKGMEWFTKQGGKIIMSDIPRTKPAFQSMFTDELGYLWVIPYSAARITKEADVFDPNGKYVTRVALPFPLVSYQARVIVRDAIYTVVKGEDDIPMVVRAKLTGR